MGIENKIEKMVIKLEMGSDFYIAFEELEKSSDNIYNFLREFKTLYLESGRIAIRALVESLDISEVLLPDYICDSVIREFENCKIVYYKIKNDLSIDIDDLKSKITQSTKAVFLMHYFGILQPDFILRELEMAKIENNFIIIEDTTHSIFTKARTIGDYCICSLRKWFPVPDGGVLYSNRTLHNIKEKKISTNTNINKIYAMALKKIYIEKKVNVNTIYREIFVDSEKKLGERIEILKISCISEFLLECYSIEKILLKRLKNYEYLVEGILNLGFEIPQMDSYGKYIFTLPIYTDRRDELRAFLNSKNIYCAVHWPLADEKKVENISKKIMSLPLDQRYEIKHMEYLLANLKKYKEIYQ